jgi:hypothetical protein
MIVDDAAQAEAAERAERVLQFRSEDGQWDVLKDLLEAEPSRQREQMIHSLALEAVRDSLYPGIDRIQWSKLGWSDVLGGRKSAAQFVHDVRLAKATGSVRGRL